jgi:hypothetical protein
MSAVSLSCKQTNMIQQNATTKFIQKCGFEKRIPRKLAYGSMKFGGFGFLQLHAESSCNKIQSLICHINNNTMLGKMFMMNLNWTQLLVGLSEPILESNKVIKYIDNNWFFQVRDFLHNIGASINIKKCWTPQAKQQNDFLLMDTVQRLDMTNVNKKIFHNWKIYFQVDSMADITNANGTGIHDIFTKENS